MGKRAGASRIERSTAALVGTPYAAQERARQSTAGPPAVPALTVERHRVVRTECAGEVGMSEREGDERWTLYVCENAHCNRAMSTKPVQPVSGSYATCIECDRPQLMRPVEVVPLSRLEAVETALREAEEWIQEVDHVEDCAAFDRASSRECDCGRTAILKRARTTTTEEVPHA